MEKLRQSLGTKKDSLKSSGNKLLNMTKNQIKEDKEEIRRAQERERIKKEKEAEDYLEDEEKEKNKTLSDAVSESKAYKSAKASAEKAQQSIEKSTMQAATNYLKKHAPINAKYRIKSKSNYGNILSAEQKKQIVKDRKKALRKEKYQGVQETIPFEFMDEDGTCRINDHYWCKMISFTDINYDLADDEERDVLFDGWCDFYNYFEPEVHVQIFCATLRADKVAQMAAVHIKDKPDNMQLVRTEFNQILYDQMLKGNNGYIRSKYIVIGLEGKNVRAVKSKFERLEENIRENLDNIGVKTHVLTGYEWLCVLRSLLNPGDFSQFLFNFDLTVRTGLTAKDYISPSSLDFRSGYSFKIGNHYAKSMFLQIQTDRLDEKLMNKILSLNHTIMVSIFAQSFDQEKAVKLLKRSLSDLDKNKIDEQKKASQGGYDMDIMPTELKSMSRNVEETLEEVQSGDDRFFNVSIIITSCEGSEKALKAAVAEIKSIAQTRSCAVKCLDYRQEKGFMATLPLGYLPEDMKVDVGLTTRAVAGFVPFTTVELFHQTGRQLYEGINALSHNPIMADMDVLNNRNSLIFGKPGYGKSFEAKKKIYNTMIATDDHIIILDPEREYRSVVEDLGGQMIVLSPTSKDHINPLDINVGYGDGKEAAVMKIDFILALMELIIGGKFGLEPIEMSIIDVAASSMYDRYFDSRMRPEDMPTLEDLYNEIKSLGREDADAVAVKMDRFVHGSSNFFNHRTNVDLSNRLICFDVKDVGTQLKPFAMMTVQDQVWNKVTKHRDDSEANYQIKYFMDEFHLQLNNPQTAAYTVEIYKRFRKYGAYPIGMTQNPYDLMISSQVESIFKNTDYVKMFRLEGDDQKLLASVLKISPAQLKYVTNSQPGRGLLFFGGTIIPFYDKFPKNTHIYEMCTTKKEELAAIAEKNRAKDDDQKEYAS